MVAEAQRRNCVSSTLFIINDAPYGNERAYNGLRLAGVWGASGQVCTCGTRVLVHVARWVAFR